MFYLLGDPSSEDDEYRLKALAGASLLAERLWELTIIRKGLESL